MDKHMYIFDIIVLASCFINNSAEQIHTIDSPIPDYGQLALVLVGLQRRVSLNKLESFLSVETRRNLVQQESNRVLIFANTCKMVCMLDSIQDYNFLKDIISDTIRKEKKSENNSEYLLYWIKHLMDVAIVCCAQAIRQKCPDYVIDRMLTQIIPLTITKFLIQKVEAMYIRNLSLLDELLVCSTDKPIHNEVLLQVIYSLKIISRLMRLMDFTTGRVDNVRVSVNSKARNEFLSVLIYHLPEETAGQWVAEYFETAVGDYV